MGRKPYMKGLKSYRFNRDGTMTQETQTEQREANKRQSPAYRMGESVVYEYAKALGVSVGEAQKRVSKQRESGSLV